MDARTENPAELLRRSQLAKDQGKQWLAAGAGVGAIGALGALIGAVCPLCVVMTPALLIAGAARAIWAKVLERRASTPPPAESPATAPPR